MDTRCTRCGRGPNNQLTLVIDARLCPSCVAQFKAWARKRRGYASRKDRLAMLSEIEAQHGAITVRRVGIATGKSAYDALKLVTYLHTRGVIDRIVRGKYRLARAAEQAAAE